MKNKCLLLLVIALTCCVSNRSFSQHKSIPLNNYYKSEFLKFSGKSSLESFYPVNETFLNLSDSLKDSTLLYYDFFVWFFRKNWLEIHENDAKLEISPLINLSYGKGLNTADSLPLYRNTRGIYATGEFSNKVSFTFMFCENQSRFMNYQNEYFNDRGEFYDNDSVFNKVNAVIPGGARTKPFKSQGYDYAFSIGSIAFQATKKLRFEVGNSQNFVGSGYRSILLSDNSIYAPALRLSWKISEKLSYQILVRKHRNLYRKPVTQAVESSYENKFFTANYLSYKPIQNFSVSLFSAGNQLRADSINMHPVKAQMLLPLPLLNTDLFAKSTLINGITGVNLDLAFNKSRYYGQIALDKYGANFLTAYQFGAYFFDFLGVSNLNIQAEMNYVPNNFYASDNQKLSFSQYNLPLAHSKGNNFTEFYVNLNYKYKRLYISNSYSFYLTPGGTQNQQVVSNSIFYTNKPGATFSEGRTLVNTFEVGIRINKKYNPTLFAQCQIRHSDFGKNVPKQDNNMFMAGLKVNLFNQYLDF